MKSLKVCVVGLGAIGTWLAYRLANQQGVELACLVRGASLKDLKTSGLHLSESSSPGVPTPKREPKALSDKAEHLGVQDWVLLCVKTTSLAESAKDLVPLLGPETKILSLMNGVPWWFFTYENAPFKSRALKSIDPLGDIQTHLPLQHWMGAVVHASCSSPGTGQCLHHFGNALIVGEPSGAQSSSAQEINDLLSRTGFESSLSTCIQKDIWYKLWGNMTINPLSALTGATTDKILGDELVKALVTNVMIEAKSIGEAIGLPIEQTPQDRHLVTAKLGAFKSSMLQDFEAKRPLELDALIGAVHEMGAWLNHKTPYMDALFGLARLQARTYGLYK